MALFECLMRKKTKEPIVSSSPKLKDKEKLQEEAKNGQWAGVAEFRERKCTFSLDFRPIGPSVLDGARRKVILRGEAYAWTLIWWTSNNSKRYGSFPTCVNPCLRTM